MKIRLLLALVGSVVGFAVPTVAQQKETPDPQLRQVADALTKNFYQGMGQKRCRRLGLPLHGRPIFDSQRPFLLGRCSPGAASRAIEVLRPQKCSAISSLESFSKLLWYMIYGCWL